MPIPVIRGGGKDEKDSKKPAAHRIPVRNLPAAGFSVYEIFLDKLFLWKLFIQDGSAAAQALRLFLQHSSAIS